MSILHFVYLLPFGQEVRERIEQDRRDEEHDADEERLKHGM